MVGPDWSHSHQQRWLQEWVCDSSEVKDPQRFLPWELLAKTFLYLGGSVFLQEYTLSSSRLYMELRGLELQQLSLVWHEDTEEGWAKTFTCKWAWQLQVMLHGLPFHFLASIFMCANTARYVTDLHWMFPTSIWRQLFKDRQNLCASEFII